MKWAWENMTLNDLAEWSDMKAFESYSMKREIEKAKRG